MRADSAKLQTNLIEGGAESEAKNIPHEGGLMAPEPGRFWLALRLATPLTLIFLQPPESARVIPGGVQVSARGVCKRRFACLPFYEGV